jgi:glycine dehydrogenase subunit 2
MKMSRRWRALEECLWKELGHDQNPSGWRPEMGAANSEGAKPATFTGNRALMLEEPLIFEMDEGGGTGVDFGGAPKVAKPPGGSRAQSADRDTRALGAADGAALYPPQPPELRHRPRLFPLGSCTMKHNPRLNEKVARMPGFADIHPLQPTDTVQGALALIEMLGEWLIKPPACIRSR